MKRHLASDMLTELMDQGRICVICRLDFEEEQPYPMACENCGGEGVLDKPNEYSGDKK